jgi:hypothetical protein
MTPKIDEIRRRRQCHEAAAKGAASPTVSIAGPDFAGVRVSFGV